MNPLAKLNQQYIGGKWRKSSDNQRFDVIDPATEKTIASVASPRTSTGPSFGSSSTMSTRTLERVADQDERRMRVSSSRCGELSA